jgi:hypothetical protein
VTLGAATTTLDVNGIAVAVVAGSKQADPAVAFGTAYSGGYLVAWTDGRNSATTGSDIFGAQVGSNGTVVSTFPISQDVEDESIPDVSAGASATKPFNVTYLKRNNALDATRLQFRRITLGTSGGQPCTQNSQCETGFCSDAKCCDTACGGVPTGDLTDCQACSVAHRGAVDGTCTVITAAAAWPCRPYKSAFCDLTELCDGTGIACPPDLGRNAGRVCNSTTGTVCPANDVTGAPHVCP